MYFKDANPDVDTVVIYTDLRMPGKGEDFYRSAQEKGVIFTKGKVPKVAANGDACKVKFHDLILDEDAAIDADLVVLATGQVPNSGVNIDAAPDEAAGEERRSKPISILNLTYRQGTDLPQLKHGLHRLALHLLPVRDAPHRHLRRRPGAPPDGHAAGHARTPPAPR